MKIKSFRKQVTKLGNVFILLCLLVSNSDPVQIAQAAVVFVSYEGVLVLQPGCTLECFGFVGAFIPK